MCSAWLFDQFHQSSGSTSDGSPQRVCFIQLGVYNSGEVGSRDEVAARAAALADSVLAVAGDNAAGDAALQRSAAEMFAFASCIGSTGFAAALVRSLAQAMAETASAPRCLVSSLSLTLLNAIVQRCFARHERQGALPLPP